MAAPTAPQPKFAYSLREFHQLGGPCRVKSYELHKAGKLQLVKAHGRTLILYDEVLRYFAGSPLLAREGRPAL
jgi:hypothetical protein